MTKQETPMPDDIREFLKHHATHYRKIKNGLAGLAPGERRQFIDDLAASSNPVKTATRRWEKAKEKANSKNW